VVLFSYKTIYYSLNHEAAFKKTVSTFAIVILAKALGQVRFKNTLILSFLLVMGTTDITVLWKCIYNTFCNERLSALMIMFLYLDGRMICILLYGDFQCVLNMS
jgi:hypothetical protein